MAVRDVKEYLSYTEQASKMSERGMILSNYGYPERDLKDIGYYRISQYSYHYRLLDADGQRLDNFAPGVRFTTVMNVHQFDTQLSYLVWDAIRAIEISLRARLGHYLGQFSPEIWSERTTDNQQNKVPAVNGVFRKATQQYLDDHDNSTNPFQNWVDWRGYRDAI